MSDLGYTKLYFIAIGPKVKLFDTSPSLKSKTEAEDVKCVRIQRALLGRALNKTFCHVANNIKKN